MAQSVKITFDDPDHHREFRNYETLLAWLGDEQAKWAWVSPHGFGNLGEQMAQAFANVVQGVANVRDSGQPLNSVEPLVSQYYQPAGFLRHSEGGFAKRIDQIRETHGDSAAAFAIAFSRQMVNLTNVTTPDQLAACILLGLPEFGRPDEIAHRLELERRNYRLAISTQLDKIDAATEERDEVNLRRMGAARRMAFRHLRKSLSTDHSIRDAFATKAADAISSIAAVEETFRVKMGLQAPVKYWEDKAAKHSVSAAAAVSRLKWFFPVAALVFVLAFGGASWLLLGSDDVHQTVYVIVAAGLASLAALIFWVGRLFTKLYLSQHHLLHDAEERAVMTTTYLALTHENAASDEDKKIILGALFRPTVDGLIKEDGPSELTLAGALSRIGISR